MCLTIRLPSNSLARWNAHAARLSRLGEHCQRVAWLEVEMKSAHSEAVAACNYLLTAGDYVKPLPVDNGIVASPCPGKIDASPVLATMAV